MHLTKYEHSHMVFELDGRKLVIDPGYLSSPTPGITEVDAFIITHEHSDHWTPEQVTAVLENNPAVPVFTTTATAEALLESVPMLSRDQLQIVTEGDAAQAGPFSFTFHGSKHAVIDSSLPIVDNFGVCINEFVYFGGDALDVPQNLDFEILAAPIGSPWSNTHEVLDFVRAMSPKRVFTVHEMMLSAEGKKLYTSLVTDVLRSRGGTVLPVELGERADLLG